MTSLSFEEAIICLRRLVKDSEVKNQKHIDLTLSIAEDRPAAVKALKIVRSAVDRGELTEAQLKEKLGLE